MVKLNFQGLPSGSYKRWIKFTLHSGQASITLDGSGFQPMLTNGPVLNLYYWFLLWYNGLTSVKIFLVGFRVPRKY
jgi:hypothetical protein